MTSRGALSSALIMDLSTNLEQSHVKQRLARFYEQNATQANQMSLASNSNSSSSSSNTHSNSRFTTVLTSTGRGTSSGDTGITWTNEVKNHMVIQPSNHAQNHLQNHTVSTIMSSAGGGGGRRGSGETEGHLHQSISQLPCNSLPSPPPPAESPAGSGSSSSLSSSSINSPYSRQIEMEGSINGYTSIISQSSGKKRKRRPQPIPENCKDDAYWERRKRNNESAKRSRELRRRKEQQTTMRVIYLEQDNLKLKTEVDMLRTEVEKLQEMLFARNGNSFH